MGIQVLQFLYLSFFSDPISRGFFFFFEKEEEFAITKCIFSGICSQTALRNGDSNFSIYVLVLLLGEPP